MRHLVILVHGIRTNAYWMTDAAKVLRKAGLLAAPTSYGRFSLARFLIPIPKLREKAIERIRSQITQAIQQYEPDCVSVIAHSFGTYVVSKIIERHPEIRWKKVIFCGSVLDESFPFNQYMNRFEDILNEIGTNDALPALAQCITWGYGSIGSHGLNNPSVTNRWNHNLKHSDFLKEDFISKMWIPYLINGEIKGGDIARPSFLARLFGAFPLRWIIVALVAFLIVFWRYIFVTTFVPPANVSQCNNYISASAPNWRKEFLLNDKIGSYYVIVKSITSFRDFPIANEYLAKLEAFRLRRKFRQIDVDAIITESMTGGNRMWAIVLARGIQSKVEACEIVRMANGCGVAEGMDAYGYQLQFGPIGCSAIPPQLGHIQR